MASKKVFSVRYEVETQYDNSAYEALSEVSWKMFREHYVRTRTYPFISTLCVLLTASLIVFYYKYSAPVIALHVTAIVFFLVSMPFSNVTGKRRLCKKAIKEVSKQGEFPFSVRFLFSEDLIRAKLLGGQIAEMPYSRITDIIVYGKWFFLFVGDHAYILHRDAFEDQEQYQSFETFLSAKTGQIFWVMDVPHNRRQLAGI